MKNKQLQQKVMDTIRKFVGDYDISNSKYPSVVEKLNEFLTKQGFVFNEADFLISKGNLVINDEGYPCLKQSIIIIPIEVVVNTTSIHNEDWVFYINDTLTNEDDIAKNYTVN